MKKLIYLVDAYNVIGCWGFLAKLKLSHHLPEARDLLLKILSEYQDYNQLNMIVVFDAMYVPTPEQKHNYHHLNVVWTKGDETADSYIEGYVKRKKSVLKQYVVVTNDNAEQRTIFDAGALRMPDNQLLGEIKADGYSLRREVHNFQQKSKIRHIPWSTKQLKMLEKLRNKLSKNDK